MKLLDTVAQRGNDGEHGYGGGAAAVASAMAWESEGEELGLSGDVWGVRESEGKRKGAAASWGCGEHDGGLGSELWWLWPRPCHGRRREGRRGCG